MNNKKEENLRKKFIEEEKKYRKNRKLYISNVNISVKQWIELLNNNNIFFKYDTDIIKRIYCSDNHATTCYDMAIVEGINPSTYISPMVNLAKRISNELNLPPVIGDCNKQVWWRILFWGRERDDGRFEWKLRPELAYAMECVYHDLNIKNYDAQIDKEFIESISNQSIDDIKRFEYAGVKRKKRLPLFINGHKVYERKRQISLNALAHADYLCEINKNHPTFIRKNCEKNYTEPHHLVPMCYSDEFEVSLDVEENIISLCSNCHNQLHYGRDIEVLLRKVYNERKDYLSKVGIEISFERLLEMYR